MTTHQTATKARSCSTPRKRRYATPEAAQASALRTVIRYGRVLRPYECPCGWWHLTKLQAVPVGAPAKEHA